MEFIKKYARVDDEENFTKEEVREDVEFIDG